MSKRKVERKFLDKWETKYLFTYTEDEPVCLVCGAYVVVTKEYNIRGHYLAKAWFKDLNIAQKHQRVEMKNI